MKIDKNIALYSIISILISLIAMIIEKFLNNDNIINLWGIVSIIIMGLSIWIWYKKYKTLYSLYLVFFIFCYFFWMGQIFIKVFGIEDFSKLSFNTESLIATVKYTVMCIIFMHIGALVVTKKANNYSFYDFDEKTNIKKSLKIVGIVLFIISAPVYLYSIYNFIKVSFSYGYMALYGYDGLEMNDNKLGILNNLKIFFMPSIFILLAAYKNKKCIKNIICIFVIIISLLLLLTGTRSSAISLIIAFLWYYFSTIKPLNKNRIIQLIVIILVLIISSNIIFVFRNEKEKTINSLIESIVSSKDDNMFVTLIKEMGGSIKALYYTREFVPQSQQFAFGYTYFASIMSVIPSQIIGGYSFADTADLPTWLMNKMQINYGPGFSIVAESYYNFGEYGIISMIFIGMIFAKLYQNNKQKKEDILIRNIFIAVAFQFSMLMIRNSTLLIFRYILYSIFIPKTLIYITKSILDRRKNKNEEIDNIYTDI